MITCVFLRPVEYARETLRRYNSGACSSTLGFHDASAVIAKRFYKDNGYLGEPATGVTNDDPRWPTRCPCGYTFQPDDHRQHQLTRLLEDDTGKLQVTLSEAPVGAMWYADWYPWRGPDGHCLVVKTPGGEWVVDGPAYSNGVETGSGWTRTGAVPKITASPSILIQDRYHGWLRDGCLVEC